jgi:predicted RNase H-like nuclease (RuvC/YqgF family)
MQEKLAMVGDVHSKLKMLETEKTEMGESLQESATTNQQLKSIIEQKDKVIDKMQTEMEKFVAIKNEVTPIFKEAKEMKKTILEKDQQIELLQTELTQATKIVTELPNIEQYVKQASEAIQTIGEENDKLKEQVYFTNIRSPKSRKKTKSSKSVK